MGSNFGDLDNDGWLDFYAGTGDPDLTTLIPNRMFRNADGKAFQEVTSSGGFGHIQKGHGVSFADLDNDGDFDTDDMVALGTGNKVYGSGIGFDHAPVGSPTIANNDGKTGIKYTSQSDGQLSPERDNLGELATGRQSWRQLK